MKAILIKPKLNAAFKVVQPLPELTDALPADLHDAAAPRFDITGRTTEPNRNAVRAAALDATENGAGGRSRRLPAVAALAGIVQSYAMIGVLPSQAHGSPAPEVRLIG